MIHILELPGLPPKGDIVDWKEAGHSKEELLALVAASQPETLESIRASEIAWGLASPDQAEADTKSIKDVEPLAPEAFHGIAGDFVRLVEPHTEADPAALLISFVVAAGNLSRNTYIRADGVDHFGNEFAAIVGNTSKGRKGTSWKRIEKVLTLLDPDYVQNRKISGLSTGEGLIWAVRNEITQQQPIKERGQITGYEQVVIDPGVSDKRLLIVEGEFSRVLKVMNRDTNTLSPVIREAWESGNLNIVTKNSPATATNAHISIVAHITAEELKRLMRDTETANGFANRFIWVSSKRSKVLPFGGTLEDDALEPVAARLGNAARFSTVPRRIEFDEEAAKEWNRVYRELSEGGRGLVGAITSRSEAHALRIAMIYALLDLSDTIKIQHLRAALAVVDYSNRSVVHIFGRKLGDDTADEILRVLTIAGDDGYTRNDLYNHFGKNKPKADIFQVA